MLQRRMLMKSEYSIPDVRPAGKPILLAEKDGMGRILHYEANDVYELRLDMENYKESHFMTGDEWEEFIYFSGQDERTEFFILLKEKYPQLSDMLEDSTRRMDFLKFIESSYDGSQTPREGG
jgi:hypothetical protein